MLNGLSVMTAELTPSMRCCFAARCSFNVIFSSKNGTSRPRTLTLVRLDRVCLVQTPLVETRPFLGWRLESRVVPRAAARRVAVLHDSLQLVRPHGATLRGQGSLLNRRLVRRLREGISSQSRRRKRLLRPVPDWMQDSAPLRSVLSLSIHSAELLLKYTALFNSVTTVAGRFCLHWRAWTRVTDSQLVLGIVKEGFFFQPTNSHSLLHHRSTREYSMDQLQMQWLEVELSRLIGNQTVSVVPPNQQSLVFTSPLFLVPKAGPKRFRLIHDLRVVNSGLDPPAFKMTQIDKLLPLLKLSSWLLKIDFKEAYTHVAIHPASRRWLGLRFNGLLLQQNTLPFGLSSSPFVYNLLASTVVKHLRSRGVVLVHYLDDWLIVGDSPPELLHTRDNILLPLLWQLGFVLEMSKCELIPTQKLVYLGVCIDLTNNRLYIPAAKLDALLTAIRALLESQIAVSARHLSSITGKLAAVWRCLPSVRYHCRALFNLISETVRHEHSWDSLTTLSQPVLDDLNWLYTNMPTLNGTPIVRPSSFPTVTSDASLAGWAATLTEPGCQLHLVNGLWTAAESLMPIHVLEARAMRLAVASFVDRLRHRSVLLRGDNSAVIHQVNLGRARCPDLCTEVKLLAQYAAIESIVLLGASWLPTELNVLPDLYSRINDIADYQVNLQLFNFSQSRQRCTVDRFASHSNRVLRRFNSLHYHPAAEATNAFSQDWSQDINWIHPPIAILGQVVSFLSQRPAEAVLLVPHILAPWWPVLVSLASSVIFLQLPVTAVIRSLSATGKDWTRKFGSMRFALIYVSLTKSPLRSFNLTEQFICSEL